MTKEQQIEKEISLLETLKNESINMLEKLKNNQTYPDMDFERARDIICRTFEDKLFDLKMKPEEYYKDYISYYYNPKF